MSRHSLRSGSRQPVSKSPAESSVRWRACCVLGAGTQLLAVGVLFDYLLFSGFAISVWLRLIAIVLLLGATWKFTGWVLLLAIQVSLFLGELSHREIVDEVNVIVYCCATLALVAYVNSGWLSPGKIGRWLPFILYPRRDPDADNSGSGDHREAGPWFRVVPYITWLAVSILVSVFLMVCLPIWGSTELALYRRSVESQQTLWPGPLLVVSAVGLVVVVREMAWRQITSAEARLYLRSAFMLAHHGDLRAIVMHRIKTGRRPTADDTGNSAAN